MLVNARTIKIRLISTLAIPVFLTLTGPSFADSTATDAEKAKCVKTLIVRHLDDYSMITTDSLRKACDFGDGFEQYDYSVQQEPQSEEEVDGRWLPLKQSIVVQFIKQDEKLNCLSVPGWRLQQHLNNQPDLQACTEQEIN